MRMDIEEIFWTTNKHNMSVKKFESGCAMRLRVEKPQD